MMLAVNTVNKYVVIACISLVAMLPAVSASAESLANYGVKDFLKGEKKKQRFTHRFGYQGRVYRDGLLARHKQIDSKQDIDVLSVVSDWHPKGGDFRFSAGVVYQGSVNNMTANSLSWQILHQASNSNLFMSNILGDVKGKGVSPYLGLGWASNFNSNQRLGVNLDIGVLYRPDSRFFEDKNNAAFSSETSKLLLDLEELELSPAFSLGLSYSF